MRNDHEILVAVGQFAVSESWTSNATVATRIISKAENSDTNLLVLPEGILTRFMDRKERIREAAQPLSGPFVQSMLKATQGKHLTVVFGIHETSDQDRPFNTVLAIRDGAIEAIYRKLHLYDAFGAVESDNVQPGSQLPPVVSVDGFNVGLMTCYDIRFPEQAINLADRGAEIIALPAAWAKGPTKEFQWSTLVSARALDTTTYLVASGESGASCIGGSRIVTPLGAVIAQCTQQTDLAITHVAKHVIGQTREKLPLLKHRRFEATLTKSKIQAER